MMQLKTAQQRCRLARTIAARRKALTLTEVLVILAILAMLIVTFVLMLPRMRAGSGGRSHRTICNSNLKGIGTGMYTYANENKDYWPVASHLSATALEVGQVNYAPKMIGLHRGSENDPKAGQTTEKDSEMSNTRNLWVLVQNGFASPGSFICPTSTDLKNDEDNPQQFWDFRNWNEISYGYQVPYGQKGLPVSDRDLRMVLVADKGPFGAALEAGKANPGVPGLSSTASRDDWSPWNSPNHGGDGQNVLYPDTHVEWAPGPTVGIKNDNIYTRWSVSTGGSESDENPRVRGTPPTSNETPWSDSDTLIYP